MEKEKASNNLADNQDCRGVVEKYYQNNILAMHIKSTNLRNSKN